MHPERLAATLGREVVYRGDLPECFCGVSFPGDRWLLVRPSGYWPRDAQTIAHEICESYLPERLPESVHEAFCQRVGAALLLPRWPFVSSLFRCRWDVPALRRRWRHASHAVIARRISDLFPGVRCHAWEDGCASWDGEVTAAELQAVEDACERRRGRASATVDGVLALAWNLARGDAEEYRGISVALPVHGGGPQ